MRYIHVNPIKSEEDKKRTSKLPRLKKEILKTMIDDEVETKVITPSKKDATLKHSIKIHDFMYNAILKDIVDSKTQIATQLHKYEGFNTDAIVVKDENGINLYNNKASLVNDLFHIKHIREDKLQAIKLYEFLEHYIIINKEHLQNKFKVLSQADLIQMSANEILDQTAKLASQLLGILDLVIPELSPVLNFGSEIGEGEKTDQTDSSKCKDAQPNPKGLITNFSWSLKPHITSIKNQNNRGTCTAFGTVAAMETFISRKFNLKTNLSEQDLYKNQKFDWNPNPWDDYYGDGYFPPISMLFQIVNGYVFPFENAWNYNPSLSRIKDDVQRKYNHSCDNYNGLACSNTNHQAHKHCYTITTTEFKEVVNEVCEFIEGIPFLGIFGGWVCDFVTDIIEIVDELEVCVYETNVPGTSRFKLTDFQLIWDPIWNSEISVAKFFLSQNQPLIYCFTVVDSWRTGNHSNSDGKGFIVFNDDEKASKDAGGHCVEIVGFVDNKNIPPKLKIAPGAGGGYFIIKNSHGKCFGDIGFAYAPYDWVEKWGTSMVALKNVVRI